MVRILTFIGLILFMPAVHAVSGQDFFANLFDLNFSEAHIAAKIYNVLFPVGIVFGLGAITWAGYGFMTSQGDPAKVKDASEGLTNAILGTLFIILSLVILRVIINTLL